MDDPILANGLPLTITLGDPTAIDLPWGGQSPQPCGTNASPTRADGIPFVITLLLPETIGDGGKHECPDPMSPILPAGVPIIFPLYF